MAASDPGAARAEVPDYGVDAPAVLRNLFVFGILALLLGIFLPARLRLGPVTVLSRSLYWPAGFLLVEAGLFLLYVKRGKLQQRDLMFTLVDWRGDERVLDVGCGRGLLLVGAAQRLTTEGHATGIDVWSNEDMGENSAEATLRNIELGGVADRCSVVSVPAQSMAFADGSFDLILSNLCLHNIYDGAARRAALLQIVRVLAPGGKAVISDYKLTGEYARVFREAGLQVATRRGLLYAFPPLRIVVASKAA